MKPLAFIDEQGAHLRNPHYNPTGPALTDGLKRSLEKCGPPKPRPTPLPREIDMIRQLYEAIEGQKPVPAPIGIEARIEAENCRALVWAMDLALGERTA